MINNTAAKERYSLKFQEEVCRLIGPRDYTAEQLAAELGVSVDRLEDWLRQRGLIQVRFPQEGPEIDDPKLLKILIRELESRVQQSEKEFLTKWLANRPSPWDP